MKEVHGFIPLNNIRAYDRTDLPCYGRTALFDATFSSIGASKAFAKSLISQDFSVNNIMYIITDGDDNASQSTSEKIKMEVEESLKSEMFGTITSILIGVNTSGKAGNGRPMAEVLKEFKNEANLTQYIDMGDVTAGKLAKLAGFVSKSVSSASQSLSAGVPVTVQAVTF